MTQRFLLLCIFLIYVTIVHAQSQAPIKGSVAEIAGKQISLEEFQNRYEFMFPFKKQYEGLSTEGKREFLYSIISEKLWAADAVQQGIDTLPEIRQLISQLQKFYMLDQYYKDSIESRITFNSTELTGAIEKLPFTLSVQMLKSADEEKIFNCFRELNSGISFDTLMNRMHGFNSPFPIVYGQFSDTAIENEVYRTQAGNYTKPLRADNQWMIIKIIKREGNEHEGKSGAALKNIAELALRRRKGMFLQSLFLAGKFKGEKIEVDGKLYTQLAKELYEALKKQRLVDSTAKNISLKFTIDEYARIKSNIGREKLQAAFILFQHAPVSLGSFIEYLPFIDVKISGLTAKNFDVLLRSEIQKFIEREHLFRFAREMKYAEHPTVERRVGLWKESLLSEKAKELFLNKVINKDSLIGLPAGHSRISVQYKYAEIVNPNLDVIDTVLQLLNFGAQFESLIPRYHNVSHTDSWANANQWTDYTEGYENDSTEIPLLTGKVIGPAKVKGGYRLLKVLDQKTVHEPAKGLSGKPEKYMDKSAELDRATVQLARKYQLTINEAALNKVQSTNLNIITIEQLGFGAKLPAYPFTAKDYEWFKNFSLPVERP
ncbi:MAG: hypothetical protein HYV28_02895 [Ignavibacteriales bacterium]|nr:hypothetical protein [Ignavibacteriales bacterium]